MRRIQNFGLMELAKCRDDRVSQVIICRFSFAWMDLVSYKDHGGADLANDERRVWVWGTLALGSFGMMKCSSATKQPKGSILEE